MNLAKNIGDVAYEGLPPLLFSASSSSCLPSAPPQGAILALIL